MKALREVGPLKIFKFIFWSCVFSVFKYVPFSPVRISILRILGAKIGRGCIFHEVKFFNLYRTGLSGLEIGDFVFLGNDVCLDLAGPLKIGSHVTLAERCMVLTHLNVGYKDHPLQLRFPSACRGVRIEDGCFVGVSSVILDGVVLGRESFVAAMSLVQKTVPDKSFVGGVPARSLRADEA